MALKATKVDHVRENLEIPGAYEIRGEYGMAFVCPCGCKREDWLPFEKDDHPAWQFDGNAETPTLTPSVLFRGGCAWHGWLRAGHWESC